MAIDAAELLCKLSTTTGPGNSTAQGTVNNSRGPFMSSTQVTSAQLNNLFDDISGAENAAQVAEYRCIFFHNTDPTLTLTNPRVYMVGGDPAGGAGLAIALDNVGVVSATSASAQADSTASETEAPSPVGTFSAPNSYAGGLAPANVGPGQCFAVWVRRTPANSAAADPDTVVLRIEGDTLP
jgi:hypothetical protein